MPSSSKVIGLLEGEPARLSTRGITLETCKRWGYLVGTHHGQTVQIATYYTDTGQPVAQKVRTKNKSMYWAGDKSRAGLYGKHLARGTRRLIITEGELDALSISQVLNYKWPVVSVPNGAPSAKKALLAELQWLSKFEEIVFCFDMDEAGQNALAECVTLFPPGKVSIVQLPLKDANEMLQEDRVDELVSALWGAQSYRPDGIVTVDDVWDQALREPDTGMPWFIPELNETTYGRRYGECVALGAGTGVGKTTFITQQIAMDLAAGHAVAVFAFEQPPHETVKRIAGMMMDKVFHIPDADQDGLEEAMKMIRQGPGLYLYDHFGACEWEIVKERIRYLARAHDVRIFYLDHLTALAAAEDDERKGLERIMAELGRLVQELGIWLLFVSHLATPEGKPHEEGGRVMIRHFKGSRAIGYWSHFMFGIERSQQSDDRDEREHSVFRVLKDRYTGKATGERYDLEYDHETGKFRTLDTVWE